MKLLRTVRLDKSDTFVFARAAEPGEWATPGGFMFWDAAPEKLDGKARAAFRSGFLGLTTFGWSTLAEVGEATPAAVEAATSALTRLLIEEHGAPSLEAAQSAAAEEIVFSESLCDHPLGTIIALQRTIEDDGSVRERFRTIKTVIEPGGNTFAQGCVLPIGIAREEAETGEPRVEEVDLVGLIGGKSGSRASEGQP
jgi:hypothetical protein